MMNRLKEIAAQRDRQFADSLESELMAAELGQASAAD
jgi:hypothetical protein